MSHLTPSTIEELLLLLHGVRKSGAGWIAQCPAHDDKRQSLSINVGDVQSFVIKCHAGCTFERIMGALHHQQPVSSPSAFVTPVALGEPVEIYPYTDRRGRLVYQALRFEPKTFRQRRPDGNGGWIWNVPSELPHYLYRLHEFCKRERATVFIVEGEKDADTLWAHKIPATTNVGGAGKWRPEYTDQLVAAKVTQAVIFPDNDEPGRRHAELVAVALHAVGLAVKVVPLPVGEKGDVSDYLAAHEKTELFALVTETPVWAPNATPNSAKEAQEPASSKATIITNVHDDWHDLLDQVFSELVAVNAPCPTLFQRGLRLVRVRVDEDERPLIEPMTEWSLKGRLAELLLWQREVRGGMVPVQPPYAVIKHLLSRSEWNGIPALRDIIQSPVFTKDGTVITTTGYDPRSRLWYVPASGLTVTVPAKPTAQDIQRARALLLDELLGEFPFTEEASRAHAVAAILLPFVRELIEGPTPLHAYTAPTAGSGKGLLVELTSIIATGHPALPVSAPREDEEMRKRITSQLRRGTPVIVLDNLSAKLESAALCAALTSEEWSDRVLGVSEMTPALPNRSLWICTANNPEFSLDVARRTIVVRIDSGEECPWKRTFKRPDIKAWARGYRSELVSAALTLVQGWLAAGRPVVEHPPIGSFESWASVIAGVLGHAGIPGFLANYEAIFEQSSGDTGEWADFVEAWFELKGNEPTYVRDLCDITKGSDLLSSVLGDGTDHSQRIRFGTALARQKDRVYGGLKIHLDGRAKGGVRYRLGTAAGPRAVSRVKRM